jgi:hypothetical protein
MPSTKNKIKNWSVDFTNTQGGRAGYGTTGRIVEKRTDTIKRGTDPSVRSKSYNTSDALVKPRIVKKAAAKKSRPSPKK